MSEEIPQNISPTCECDHCKFGHWVLRESIAEYQDILTKLLKAASAVAVEYEAYSPESVALAHLDLMIDSLSPQEQLADSEDVTSRQECLGCKEKDATLKETQRIAEIYRKRIWELKNPEKG